MHMRHGMQQRQQKSRLRQTSVMNHVAVFVIGKLGVHTGGIGDTKPIPSTKEIFLILWCCYIIMTSHLAQQLLSCVSQEMTLGGSFQLVLEWE